MAKELGRVVTLNHSFQVMLGFSSNNLDVKRTRAKNCLEVKTKKMNVESDYIDSLPKDPEGLYDMTRHYTQHLGKVIIYISFNSLPKMVRQCIESLGTLHFLDFIHSR